MPPKNRCMLLQPTMSEDNLPRQIIHRDFFLTFEILLRSPAAPRAGDFVMLSASILIIKGRAT
jgi:hypothetical protein